MKIFGGVAVILLLLLLMGVIKSCNPSEPEVTDETTEETTTESTTVPEVTEEVTTPLPETGGDELASFYGEELRGSVQANGLPFEPWANTVASWDYDLGDELLVCDEFCTTAVVTDRGPAGWTGKDIDLSLGTAYWCGLLDEGVGVVYVEEV